MPVARCALFSRPRLFPLVGAIALASALLLPTACSDDHPTEPASEKPGVQFSEASAGFLRDDFTDADGTLLQNHTPDGGGDPFRWLPAPLWGFPPAVIEGNAVVARPFEDWVHLTSVQTGDQAELQVEVLAIPAPGAVQEIGLWVRTQGADGSHDGAMALWSFAADSSFLTVERPNNLPAVTIQRTGPLSVGLHTLRIEINSSAQAEVRIDSALIGTVPLGTLPPPGYAAIGTWANGTPVARLTSFRAGAPPVVRIEPVNEPMDVWPKGVPGGSPEVQLRVRVVGGGVNLKDQVVKLSLTAVDSSGRGSDGPYGHFHDGVGGLDKPTGKLDPEESVNTGSDGLQGLVKYTSSPVSGPIVVRAEMEGSLPDSLTIPVRVPGLEQLAPNGTFTLVGVKPIHPSSHWVTAGMHSRLIQLAQIFHENHAKKLGYNDASLPFGGKFDLNRQWGDTDPTCEFTKDGVTKKNPIGCHQTHRRGVDLDLDIFGLTKEERTRVRTRWAAIAKLSVINEGDHFHLPYRP